MSNLPAKFEVSSLNCSRDMSQNSKSISRDPITTPFDLILHFAFFRLGRQVANLHVKFEVSS